jgi:hypothetical protein
VDFLGDLLGLAVKLDVMGNLLRLSHRRNTSQFQSRRANIAKQALTCIALPILHHNIMCTCVFVIRQKSAQTEQLENQTFTTSLLCLRGPLNPSGFFPSCLPSDAFFLPFSCPSPQMGLCCAI